MKLLRTILLAISLLGFTGLSAQAETIDDIKKRGEIRVGLSTFVPWAFRDKTGNLVGFEIDVATKLAQDLGVKLQLVNTAWDGIIPALQSKKFDVIISGMSVNEKRKLSIDFSSPYGSSGYILLAAKKHEGKMIADFNSRSMTFSTRRGGVPATLAKKNFPKAKLLQFDEDGLAALELLTGKVDAIVDTSVSASKVKDENPNRVVYIENAKELKTSAEAMGLRKGNPETLKVFNDWIAKQKKSGWLQKRAYYWFKTRDWKDKLPQ